MDYHRAQQNLQLLNDCGEQDVCSGNAVDDEVADTRSMASTQIPDLNFSSDVEANVQDLAPNDERVFLSTQVQSRLDDAEDESEMKSQLRKFKYPQLSMKSLTTLTHKSISPKKSSQPKQRVAKRNIKKARSSTNATPSNIDSHSRSRSVNLLKQLSGKHSKVKDMIKSQNNKRRPSNRKNESLVLFDTYNAEEWNTLKDQILLKFPKCDDNDLNEVHNYLYGYENEDAGIGHESTDLWNASQQLLPYTQESKKSVNNSQTMNFLSLSQVMEDASLMNDDIDNTTKFLVQSKDHLAITDSAISQNINVLNTSMPRLAYLKGIYDGNDDNDVRVEDSVDEVGELIPINEQGMSAHPAFGKGNIPSLIHRMNSNESSIFSAHPSPEKPDNIIDLSVGSFKAVKSLVSPIKPDVVRKENGVPESIMGENIQVPATRNPTTMDESALATKLTYCISIKLKLRKDRVTENKKSLENICKKGYNFSPSLDQMDENFVFVDESDDENEKYDSNILIDIFRANNVHPMEIPSQNHVQPSEAKDGLMSCSAQELRSALKLAGLKPVRTKSEMVESLEAASQVLSQVVPLQNSRKEIFRHLNSLVRKIPDLMKLVYTFEPIPFLDLRVELSRLDPFIDRIDDQTFREWTDSNGITTKK
ncbi:Slx4p KNAG_0G02500 [Huiozyma naganishii CBS 8797]|uniref:Structure-specific endonuclease subunit SLX4 n=1 Tax=Huiozyma naganishii (strain ATCC MYA-139 / BCRC 22969 / CBS 8797 / KCTC 17520 / NBRC 10181 / NCYC 3082 / Yp74L-3) TaxID=1071383 RepID=J7S158_HUIN7|nr:hypothetical protein KNAG_0G02500 [Kazachstania naganishii CBS 8797]CCK71307.1 hypothetical protein KNAG_0G02500 [Kazachstania naganishii CBS 8797]